MALNKNLKANEVPPFEFTGKTKEEMADILDKAYPVNLRYNEELVNRVHTRYPLLKKAEVALIIKAVFSSCRYLLVLGNVLNFSGFIGGIKMCFYSVKRLGITHPCLKIKVATPIPLRKGNK